MDHFTYRNFDLCCEQVSLRSLAADIGTPAYVYSKAALLESYRAYDDAFAEVPHVVCYSIKANANLGVLATLARAGAGADIVSGGELFRALRAGFRLARLSSRASVRRATRCGTRSRPRSSCSTSSR